VLVDVFYDHFLARDFAAHTGRDLREFVAQVYAALRARRQAFPEFVGTVMERMIEQDWLGCYATVDGIGLTLERIAGRLSRPTNLPAGIADLRAAYDALDADFRQFWPCVVEHVKAERAKFVVRPDGTPG
jgi:acyl carrier protein phosphodiesterase